MQIRRAVARDAQELSALALRAKAHWGYAAAQLEAWVSSLEVSAEFVVARPTFVGEVDGRIVGFYSLVPSESAWEIDNLWVAPESMLRGFGRALFLHAMRTAAGGGAASILVDADPNAEAFYAACGARRVGEVAAPIAGQPERVRPQLVFAITREVHMSHSKAEVQAAKAYEALFVPALFAQWAPKVADAADLQAGQRVLDVACGTGVLAREALRRTGSAGYVAGVDPGSGMLAVAKELSPALDCREGVAESLPFEDASFDAVVSQFGLMFMDGNRALREMLRVLKPHGHLVVAVWDRLEHLPAYAVAVALLQRLAGTRAADALRAPFVLGDRDRLAEMFKQAGARSVTISTSNGVARFPSIRTMVEADLRGWLPIMGVRLTEEEIARILEEAEDALAAYVTDGRRVEFEAPAHVVTASKF